MLVGGIQFTLLVVVGESFYPGYSTSKNTLSDMSGSCPSVDPTNPIRCVERVIHLPSAAIFSSTVFAIGATTATSAYLIRKSLGGSLAPAMLMVTGIGAMGVAAFPGNAGTAHGLFSITTFSAGAAAAICSYRLLKESRSMQYVSLALGGIAAVVLLSVTVLGGNQSPLIQYLGVGGAERLVAYPIVLWLVALGGYLLAVSSLARSTEAIGR